MMKKISRLIIAILSIFILTVTSQQNVVQASTLPLKYCVDFIKYESKTKTINVQGWALSGSGIKNVLAVVNGKTYNTNPAYRSDVHNAYKQYNNKNAGFNKSIPISNQGIVNVQILIIEKNGKITKYTTAVTIPKTPVVVQKTVYFTPNGKSYHYNRSCSTLSRSKTVLSGTIQNAINSGHADPCDKCVK